MQNLPPFKYRLVARMRRLKEDEKLEKLQKISFLKMFYRVLTILFILGLLGLTYFLSYYIFCPVAAETQFFSSIDKSDSNNLSSNSLADSDDSFFSIFFPSASSPSRTVKDRDKDKDSNSETPPLPKNSLPVSSPNNSSAQLSNNPSPVSITSSNTSNPNDGLTFGDFYDDFPNSVYIDTSKTTLYQDKTATAVFFPPVYDWQNAASSVSVAAENSFQPSTFNDFNGPYNDRRCLENNCLVQKDKTLYYNANILELPTELKSSNLIALSISILKKTWLVGATLKNGDTYQGLVFYFDGEKFIKIITREPIVSPYFGLWGFGGEENDFLMIYGAYKGIAYHVYNNNLTDISGFFDIRAMNGGFKAEVIRVAFNYNVNWYVYSGTLNRPWFFKLWQNGGAEIVGEAFFNNIFNSSLSSLSFKLLNTDNNQVSLLAQQNDTNGQLSDKVFTDRGFDNASSKILITNSLSNKMLDYKIVIQKVFDVNLNLDSASQNSVRFLFSSDAKNWQSIVGLQQSNFVADATPYYLKIIFPASSDRFYSPYLNSMLFSYYWKKADIKL